MAGSTARMTALVPGRGARLLARGVGGKALSCVAHFNTFVFSARCRSPAGLATGYSFNQTGNIFSFFVTPETLFYSELSAGWTVSFTVAAVSDGVFTRVTAPTHLVAFRWSCSTGYWRVNNGGSAVAMQFVKTRPRTCWTVSSVTHLFTPVQSTRQQFAAD